MRYMTWLQQQQSVRGWAAAKGRFVVSWLAGWLAEQVPCVGVELSSSASFFFPG